MSDWDERSELVMNSMSSSLEDFLITDPYEYVMENTANARADNLFRRDPNMYLDYLEDWDWIEGLITCFASPLREVLSKSQYKISFKDDSMKSSEDFINAQLAELDMPRVFVDSLKSVIYRGSYFKLLVYNSENKKFKVLDMRRPWRTTLVKRLGQPVGYIRNGKFLDLKEGVFGAYNLTTKKTVSLKDIKTGSIQNSIKKALGKNYNSRLEDDILAYTHSIPRGLFFGQAQKLFQIYLNEFILQFLALKDSVRQDLITVTVTSVPKRTVNTAQVAQAIEDAVNQGSNLVVQQDPQNLLSQVVFALFNNARVLPSVDNYSNINSLELQNLKDKRAQLYQETEDLKRQVIANLGIPEELQAGTGNRWEILSRSDKYLTSINSFVSMFEDILEQQVVSMMHAIGRNCAKEDVVFSLTNDTPLQSQMSRNKTALIVDAARDSINIINAAKGIISTGFVDGEKLLKDFVPELQRWGLPFADAYYDVNTLMQHFKDPGDPINGFTNPV